MPANFKKFDVKHGLSVNGLEFVDENRNVTLNNLTVQGTSTVVDTRTVTAVDPIISLGTAGSTHTITEVTIANPGRIKFGADAFDDIAVGDSFEYNSTGTDATPLTSGNIYYVISKETDVTSANYRTITFSANQGGTASAITGAGSGTQTIILNPLRDLGQDLGIEFNYVESASAKKGFFGFDDSAGRFTFLLDTTYRGQSTQSDDGTPLAPDFTGTKSGAEFSYAKLEPSSALTTNQSALDIDQIWNDSNVTFKAIEVDITDTNSAIPSKFLNFSAGGYTKFAVRKDGALTFGTPDATSHADYCAFFCANGSNNNNLKLARFIDKWIDIDEDASLEEYIGIDLQITNIASLNTSKLVNFFSTDDRKYELYWDGHSVQEVEFTGGGAQTAITVNVTDTSSANDSLLLDLQVDDVSKFSVDKDGDIISAGGLTINGPGNFEDTITIQSQTNGTGNYADTTEFQASTSTIPAGETAATTINSFTATSFTSAEVIVQVKQGSNIHTSKLLLIHDGTDVWLTEYGTVYNSDILVTWDAIVSGGNVVIQATNTAASAAANAITTVKTSRTAIAA